MSKIFLPLLLATCACCALAQGVEEDAPLYEGVWNVRFAGQRAARFELRDWAGSWRETGATKGLPAACHGRKLPISVQHSTPEHLEFTVWGSSVNPGCPDTTYEFKPRDAKTLEGVGDAGLTMTRVRK